MPLVDVLERQPAAFFNEADEAQVASGPGRDTPGTEGQACGALAGRDGDEAAEVRSPVRDRHCAVDTQASGRCDRGNCLEGYGEGCKGRMCLHGDLVECRGAGFQGAVDRVARSGMCELGLCQDYIVARGYVQEDNGDRAGCGGKGDESSLGRQRCDGAIRTVRAGGAVRSGGAVRAIRAGGAVRSGYAVIAGGAFGSSDSVSAVAAVRSRCCRRCPARLEVLSLRGGSSWLRW